MSAVHFLVPAGIDDPQRASGGNGYDRRLRDGLRARGWDLHEQVAPGSWPSPDEAARQSLARQVDGVADGQVLLVDGLIASTVPDVLVPAARRVALVVLVHLPLGAARDGADTSAAEGAVLAASRAVVTTSSWSRDWLLSRYPLRPERVTVAEPGADAARSMTPTPTGGQLLCVGAVVPAKGHDLLITALAAIADLPWRCVCVGPLDRDLAFVRRLRQRVSTEGMGERIRFTGPRSDEQLDACYRAADVLVHPSRLETYGMVITEALAHGVPVIATDVGGIPATLGRVSGDHRPGVLVPADDPRRLAETLRSWLLDATLRARLRAAAGDRRNTLQPWSRTVDRVAHVLIEVSERTEPAGRTELTA